MAIKSLAALEVAHQYRSPLQLCRCVSDFVDMATRMVRVWIISHGTPLLHNQGVHAAVRT